MSTASVSPVRVLALLALALAGVALWATTRVSATAPPSVPVEKRVTRATNAEAALVTNYRPYEERVPPRSDDEHENISLGGTPAYHGGVHVRRTRHGSARLIVSDSWSSGHSSSESTKAVTVVHPLLKTTVDEPGLTCSLNRRHAAHSVPYPFPSVSEERGALLYGYSLRGRVHGYRCVSGEGFGARTVWTFAFREPEADARAVRSGVWRRVDAAARPVAAVLFALGIVAVVTGRRRAFEALRWREARRGSDGVVRVGDEAVRVITRDRRVTSARELCVVIAERGARDAGPYRRGGERSATHVRVGSLADLHAWTRRREKLSTTAVFALGVLSFALSAVWSCGRPPIAYTSEARLFVGSPWTQ